MKIASINAKSFFLLLACSSIILNQVMVLGYNSNRVSALIQVQPQSQKAVESPGKELKRIRKESLDINKDNEFAMP